jgi:hypothetical protein
MLEFFTACTFGPSEVRALPVRRCRRAVWRCFFLFFLFSLRLITFSPRRDCPRDFSIKVLAISDNSNILKKQIFEVVFNEVDGHGKRGPPLACASIYVVPIICAIFNVHATS